MLQIIKHQTAFAKPDSASRSLRVFVGILAGFLEPVAFVLVNGFSPLSFSLVKGGRFLQWSTRLRFGHTLRIYRHGENLRFR